MWLTGIIPYQDSDLEKLYTYARFLLLKLPRRKSGLGYEIEDEVALKFYRLQKISEGGIDLSRGEAEPLKGPTEVGTGRFKGLDEAGQDEFKVKLVSFRNLYTFLSQL
jgi:type I restriction enzyme R subunit